MKQACSAVQFTTVYSRTACTLRNVILYSSPGTAEQRPGYAYDVGWYSKTWMILYDDGHSYRAYYREIESKQAIIDQRLHHPFSHTLFQRFCCTNSSMGFNYKEKWWVPVINVPGNEKSREGKIEKSVEQENEHDGGVGGKLVTGCSIYIGTNSLKAEKYDHTENRGQDEGSTTNFIDQRSGD